MPAPTPEQRRLSAQIAANTRWSREDPAHNAQRGQTGLLAKFAREVDPNNELTEAERTRRAKAAHRAHMQRLALTSAKARAARKQGAA